MFRLHLVHALFASVLAIFGAVTSPGAAFAQQTVFPRRARQTRVRWQSHDWRTLDVLTTTPTTAFTLRPRPEGAPDPRGRYLEALERKGQRPELTKTATQSAGLRLYFYDSARPIAGHAAALIEAEYRRLVTLFSHIPERRFPYILYDSYQEFLTTNLFPLSEGTLGVTSPIDLTLTLPYFGDDRLFRHVSSHELVHQFTIQKIVDVTKSLGLGRSQPIENIPLWFIEGLAEYYAWGGVDDETWMFLRDLVVNPQPRRGYGLEGFFTSLGGFLGVYKLGQVRCAFLEETYGPGTLQAILEASPLLVSSFGDIEEVDDFPALLQYVTGDPPDLLSRKFVSWAKEKSFPAFEEASQKPEDFELVPLDQPNVLAMAASPDGRILAFRTIDPETGRVRLKVFDHRNPEDLDTVVTDGRPGVESLHPNTVGNFALGDEAIVYVAESEGGDVVYWRRIERGKKKPRPSDPRRTRRLPKRRERFVLDLEEERRFDLLDAGIVAVNAVAVAPDGERIALIGVDERSQADVWVLSPTEGDAFDLSRMTDDRFTERGIAWGENGIVFTSNATSHAKFNVFRVDPTNTSSIARITTEARDHQDPAVLPGGRVIFAAMENGRRNLYTATSSSVVQRTSVTTGLSQPMPGPEGSVWAMYFHGAAFRIARIPSSALLDAAPRAIPAAAPLDARFSTMSLENASDYRASDLSNWRLGTIFGLLGVGGGGIWGQVSASATDVLRDHAVVVALQFPGRIELTDGYALYVNQSGRFTWAVGPFQSVFFRFYRPEATGYTLFGDRFSGLQGILQFPLNRFVYAETFTSAGVLSPFELEVEGFGLDPTLDPADSLAAQAEVGLRLGVSTLRYHVRTGPFDGVSAMLDYRAGYRTTDSQPYALIRADGELYLPIVSSANLMFRGAVGGSIAGDAYRLFYLASRYTVRGIDPSDVERLVGRYFFHSTAELQVPMSAFVKIFLFSEIEAVVAVDFGGIGDSPEDALDRYVFDLVLGVNFVLGPFEFRLHFAKPLETGQPLASGDDWVTNFTIGFLYL